MKRLNFKKEFTSEEQMKELIPENYKVNDNVFLMTDGNQTYKVRWDESLSEATVLNYKNKNFINENVEKMKSYLIINILILWVKQIITVKRQNLLKP